MLNQVPANVPGTRTVQMINDGFDLPWNLLVFSQCWQKKKGINVGILFLNFPYRKKPTSPYIQ